MVDVSQHYHNHLRPENFGVTNETLIDRLLIEPGLTDVMNYGQMLHLADETLKFVYPEVELFIVNEGFLIGKDSFTIGDTKFQSGKIINTHLKNAGGLCFFFGTVGESITYKIRHYQIRVDSLSGYLVHLLATHIVELMIDYAQNEIFGTLAPGMIAGNRVSPGYCGWEVAEQDNFFRLFNDKKIKISLNESALMIPDKSVTGLWGYGEKFRRIEYNCDRCEAEMCYKKFR